MLGELMVAARGLNIGKNIFSGGGKASANSNASSGYSSGNGNSDSSAAFGFMPGGIAGAVSRGVRGGAESAATGKPGGGVLASIGGKVFQSSLNKGGDYANSVISTVAHGDIRRSGTISGENASAALSSYFGGAVNLSAPVSQVNGNAATTPESSPFVREVSSPILAPEPTSAAPIFTDESSAILSYSGTESAPKAPYVTLPIEPVPAPEPGGAIASTMQEPASPIAYSTESNPGSDPNGNSSSSTDSADIPYSQPRESAQSAESIQKITYSDVEIGGGRITGYESSAPGEARQFAMYSAEQYTRPDSGHDTLTAVDGSKWYRQCAQNAIEKTPYKASDGSINFNETLIQKLPNSPKRKDRI
jgi:hypothetical protein